MNTEECDQLSNSFTLADLCKELTLDDVQLIGDGSLRITGLSEIDNAARDQLIFISSEKYLKKLLTNVTANANASNNDNDDIRSDTSHHCLARALLISRALLSKQSVNNDLDKLESTLPVDAQQLLEHFTGIILVRDAYLAYAKLSRLFQPQLPFWQGVHPTAWLAEDVELGEHVVIGPHCTVAAGCRLGDGTRLAAGVHIGPYCQLGNDCFLHSNVVLYHKVKLGDRVIIHSGAVLGADGFGYAHNISTDANGHRSACWQKIYQLGGITIGDDVEIGANTTIDRGALHDTRIAKNVKLDNLIQLAHNTEVGEGTAIAACAGIAGSTKIGRHCLIGGGVGMAGFLEIADQVVITGGSMVGTSLTKPGVYASSIPAVPKQEWWKTVACLFKLHSLVKEFKNFKEKFSFSYWYNKLF